MTRAVASAGSRERLWLGHVPIDPLTREEALDAIARRVASGAGGTVFTPNVDHVVLAETDPEFRRAYVGEHVARRRGSRPAGGPPPWLERA